MVPGKDKNNLRRLLLIFTFLQHSLSQFPCLAQEDDFDVLFLPPALVLQHILQRLANALAFLFTFARSKSKLGKPEFIPLLKQKACCMTLFISQVIRHTRIIRLKANPGPRNVHNSGILRLIRLRRKNMVVQLSGNSIQASTSLFIFQEA